MKTTSTQEINIDQEYMSVVDFIKMIEFKEDEKDLAFYATYADGIGAWYKEVSPEFISKAQNQGLSVHGYTFRADDLGDFNDFDSLLSHGLDSLKFDGIFTDHPDKAVKFLEKRRSKN